MDDDQSAHPSEDDALEPVDDIFNPAVDEEKLDGDYDTPAAPAVANAHHVPPDHPITDTDIDADELYNEGLGEATDMDNREDLPTEGVKPLDPED